jgi:hypothetical protein
VPMTRSSTSLIPAELVADGMKGVHLRTKNITFTSSCNDEKKNATCGRRSTASQFEHLLHEAPWTKMVMLHYAAECVTDDVIESVLHKCPAVSSVSDLLFEQSERPSTSASCPRVSSFLRTSSRHLFAMLCSTPWIFLQPPKIPRPHLPSMCLITTLPRRLCAFCYRIASASARVAARFVAYTFHR